MLLTEQNRITDIAYSEILTRISEGKGTQADYEVLNSRIITNIDVTTGKFTNAPVVVPGNRLREQINHAHAKHHSKKMGKRLFISKAVDTCSKIEMTKSKLQQTQQLPYTKTGNLPGKLRLFIGLPVMLTHNIAVELGLTNGAFGVVTRIAIENEQNLKKSDDGYIMENVPEYVIVRFPGLKLDRLPGLDDEEVPIFPMKTSFGMKFPRTMVKSTISRFQIPLVEAYSYTSYKSQGKTLNAIITDLVPPVGMPTNPSFAYVPLSRVRSLQDLVILRPFPITVLQAKQSEDLISQNERFKLLDQATNNCEDMDI